MRVSGLVIKGASTKDKGGLWLTGMCQTPDPNCEKLKFFKTCSSKSEKNIGTEPDLILHDVQCSSVWSEAHCVRLTGLPAFQIGLLLTMCFKSVIGESDRGSSSANISYSARMGTDSSVGVLGSQPIKNRNTLVNRFVCAF